MPIYPGYVVATAASLLIGRPVKWIEDRTDNLISTGFARDYYMDGSVAIDENGKFIGLRVNLLSDNGAFFADAQPSRFKAGLFHIVTGSYDIPAAHIVADGAYTNKAPGGVAYRCSFRVTEASYFIERLVENAAVELGQDPVTTRLKNFIQPEAFPYKSASGSSTTAATIQRAMKVALDMLGYDELRKEQAEKRARGELMGIGVASFTEVVGAGKGKEYDIAGLRMFDSAELRVHPTGKGDPQARCEVAGPGTRDDVRADRRRGARHPRVGHRGSRGRHRQHAVRSRHLRVAVDAGRRRRDRDGVAQAARQGQDHRRASLRGGRRRHRVRPRQVLRQGVAGQRQDDPGHRVRGVHEHARTGIEAGLEGVTYYDPPNMTFPFGTYLVVVDIDKGTGQVKVRRMVAVDDCGVRINPMIVEGQIHGGLTEGFGIAFMELITFDDEGNCIGSNFMDYLIPTAWETPRFELGETVTPSPHHPIGAKGVGESATVGSPAAYVNAVIDALSHLGITNIDMPVTSDKVWAALRGKGVTE